MACNNNGGLCGNFTGANWWWIILLVILFSCICNNDCGCHGGCEPMCGGSYDRGGCGGSYDRGCC